MRHLEKDHSILYLTKKDRLELKEYIEKSSYFFDCETVGAEEEVLKISTTKDFKLSHAGKEKTSFFSWFVVGWCSSVGLLWCGAFYDGGISIFKSC